MISALKSYGISQFHFAVMKFYEVQGKAIFLKQVKTKMHKQKVMDYYFGLFLNWGHAG